MPLTANFIADFSSFLDATRTSITATKDLELAAAKVGPALDQSLDQASAAADETNKKMFELGQGIGKTLASQELRRLAGDVTSFATHYIQAFAESESATSRLTVALKESGQVSPAVTSAYGAMATELQRISTFSDDAITDAQTLLTTLGGIKPDNMREVLGVTMDLAHGMKIDLAEAAKLVSTAVATQGEHLGKLKKYIGDNIKPGADLTDIMRELNEQFGGSNAAALETTAGQMENLKNAMAQIDETVGKTLAANLKAILDLFQQMPEGVQTFILAVFTIGTALAPVLVSLASLVGLLKVTGLGAGILAAFEAIAAFIGPVGWIALGVIALAAIFHEKWYFIVQAVESAYKAIKYWLVDQLTWVFQQVEGMLGKVVGAFKWAADAIALHSLVPDMVNVIGQEFGRLDRIMVGPAEAAAADVIRAFNGIGAATVPTASAALAASARGGAAGATNVTINMTGMMGTDDPQTRAMLRGVVSDALMQGMRGSRLLGTA